MEVNLTCRVNIWACTDLLEGSCGNSTNYGDWCGSELQSLIRTPVRTRPGNSLHLAWLWVSEAAAGVGAGPSGHGHSDLVMILGNVFHLDPVSLSSGPESVPSLRACSCFSGCKAGGSACFLRTWVVQLPA